MAPFTCFVAQELLPQELNGQHMACASWAFAIVKQHVCEALQMYPASLSPVVPCNDYHRDSINIQRFWCIQGLGTSHNSDTAANYTTLQLAHNKLSHRVVIHRVQTSVLLGRMLGIAHRMTPFPHS